MYKKYVTPVTDVVNLNLQNSVLTEGDAAGSGYGQGGWGNTDQLDFEDDEVDDVQARSKSLWE